MVDVERSLTMKSFLAFSLIFISTFSLTEVINLKCFNEGQIHGNETNWSYGETRVVQFAMGESSKLAKMVAKGYPLIEFDLKITPSHYLIGQYKTELKKELIPIFKINKTTLILEEDSFFSKQNAFGKQRNCILEK